MYIVVVSKEGFAGGATLIFFKHNKEGLCLHSQHMQSSAIVLYSQCHSKTRIDGARPANPSFGMTARKILRHVFLAARNEISCYIKC